MSKDNEEKIKSTEVTDVTTKTPSKIEELDTRIGNLQNELTLLNQQKEIENTRIIRQKYFTILTEDLDKFLGDNKLTDKNIANANIHLMQTAESYSELEGRERKTIVLDVLDKRMQKDEEHFSILSIIDSFIDGIVKVDKGEISLSIDADKAAAVCCGICVRGLSKK